MNWDTAAPFYDAFMRLYNRRGNERLCAAVAARIDPGDAVLECACGTGLLTLPIAQACKTLLATDLSAGMLKQAMKKCRRCANVTFARVSITKLPYASGRFDKVVAANVIHLLDEPDAALRELVRVCRPGGKILVPTYLNREAASASAAAKLLTRLGISFRRQFSLAEYRRFFARLGWPEAEYLYIEGRMPCAVAVLTKPERHSTPTNALPLLGIYHPKKRLFDFSF